MAHGKPVTESPLPPSCWWDVHSQAGTGHWVPAEGDTARTLIRPLTQDYQVRAEQLFLITPFRDCAKELVGIARAMGLDWRRAGTIHTAQGREADIVILVLGGGDQPSPKNWVAEKPNMLNVAVSRAKKRLYIIGDRADWSQRRYFDDAVRHLPVASPGGTRRKTAAGPQPAQKIR